MEDGERSGERMVEEERKEGGEDEKDRGRGIGGMEDGEWERRGRRMIGRLEDGG